MNFTKNTTNFSGGAINVQFDNVILSGSGTNTFTENKATNASGGGGAILADGNVTFSGSGTNIFTGNVASAGKGGAILTDGNVTFSGSGTNTFTENNATNGGAIYAGGNVDISGSGTNIFTGNNATSGGGAIYANTGNVTLSGGTNIFTGNKAATYGGAIYVDAGDVALSGTNAFENNTATGGGAIYAGGDVALSGGNNTFTGNTATYGGAIYVERGNVTLSGGNNTFTGNKASDGSGGAIIATNGKVDISDGTNTFKDNTATHGGAIAAKDVTLSGGTNTFTGNKALGSGGVILTSGGVILTSGEVTLSDGNNTFENNTATYGGAIVANDNVTLSGGTNTFANNTATRNGGAIYASWSDVTLSCGTNTFTGNNATTYGGAIYVELGDVTLSGSGTNTFTGNTASTGSGGAIFTTNGKVDISGTNTFENNTANRGNGGAIRAGGSVTIFGSGTNTFNNNTATSGNGGAIYADAGNVTISGGTNTFTGNEATNSGGAILANGNVTLSGGNNTFEKNAAAGGGGGAIVANGNVTLSGNNTFTGNTASRNSGAIYAGNGNIYLTPTAGNSIDFMTATDTLATGNASSWVHIGGVGGVNFLEGFNNPGITTVHFGANNYTAYDASAGWVNSSAMNVTNIAGGPNTTGWAATTGSGRTNRYSEITGNFVLGDNQTLSLDMNVANSTSVPYFTVTGGDVTTGSNTRLYGVITGNLLSATAGGNYTYVVFNVTNGNGTGFAPTTYLTSNKLVTLANPTFYGNETGGTFTVDVKRIANPPTPPVSPDPPAPDPGNGTVIPKDETHSGGSAENGGGMHSNGPTEIINNATANFTGNTAKDSGGGLHSAGSVTVKDNASAVFTNNTAASQGGGIFSGGNVTTSGSSALNVSGNTAGQGGGVYANGDVTLNGNTTFVGNTAKDKGGAIFAAGDVFLAGNAEFSGNAAVEGGAIHTSGDVHLAPAATGSIRFATATDSIHAQNLIMDGKGTTTFNAPNIIADSVVIKSGTARLTAANTFSNTSISVEGGTLHMGVQSAKSRMTRGFAMDAASTTDGVAGSGASASFASNLKGLHMGDGTILSLDMDHVGNAHIPYFTLASGYAATTGTGTTLYGVIGQNLLSAAGGKWTYSLFSGSSGAAGAFAPASYRTSNALVSLANPTYVNGEFTLDVVRNSQPNPDPNPPTPDPDPNPPVPPTPEQPIPPTPEQPVPPTPSPAPKPVITGDFMGLFPKNSLQSDMEMILYYDYFYNGGTIANPGPGTLIGQNAFMDGLMLVLPNGQDAFTPGQRLLALDSAASMTDMSGSIDMLRDTGNRLRGQIFATDAVRTSRATVTKTNDAAQVNLWASPVYSHESGKNRGQYGSVDAGYRFNSFGGVIGLDTLFNDGKFRAGGVFTVGRGSLDSNGEGLKTQNDADYVGGALFGAWLPMPEWEFGVYAGYINQNNDVEQENILNLNSKFDTSLWQIGVNAKYETAIGNDGKRKLSAGVGVDAQMYTRDSHGISANGKDIANMGKSDLNQVQIPFTVGLQDTFDFKNGSTLTLDGRIGYRLTLGDLATKSDWSIPGGNHKARISGPDADRNTGIAGVGAMWKKEQFSIGVGYDVEFAAKRTNHQVSGQVRWEF